MFDAIKFGVGIVSNEGFESFKDAKIYYNYAWTYNEKLIMKLMPAMIFKRTC